MSYKVISAEKCSIPEKALSQNAAVCNILQRNEISHVAFINMPNLLAFYEIRV